MPDWCDPHWLAEAARWIREQLGRLGVRSTGAIAQHHVRPWATVLRVPTADGDVWFKANAPRLRHETALVGLLAERRPDCVPPLLAVDDDRGWMLMADAGTSLRDILERERDLARWLDVLPLYAGVQLDLAREADALVGRGVPDVRLATLPARYEALLDALADLPDDDRRRLAPAIGEVRELCDELAAFGIAETIQHDDLHDGQIYVRAGRYLLLDWGDACVSHPFFTLAVTLGGVLSWGLDDVPDSVDVAPFRDAYLEPFTGGRGRGELERAATIAMRLGWVARAVNAHAAGWEEESRAHVRLRMFLDGRP